MKHLEENKIKKELERLSKHINLKFQRKWFKVVWITKEQEILTEYLSDCRDPIYEKYGKSLNKRIGNLEKFYQSVDYKNCIRRYGGQVIPKKSFFGFRKFVGKIKNKKVREILLEFCDKIEREFQDANKIAALTETDIEKEKKALVYRILRHEWLHILLEENKIKFKDWKYNEGLITYFEFYLDKSLGDLEKISRRETYEFNKEYFRKAIYFRKCLGADPQAHKIKSLLNLK